MPPGQLNAVGQQSNAWAQNPQDAAASAPSGTLAWRDAAMQAFLEMHALLEVSTSQMLVSDETSAPADGSLGPIGDARISGTTATVALLLPNPRCLVVAHVGDSRAVLGTRRRDQRPAQWRVNDLTRDHKPDLAEERARIEERGAQVLTVGTPPNTTTRVFTPFQTWPSINMSRSLGDLHAHTQGVSQTPDVSVLEQLWNPSLEEAILVIASDGLWDVIDSGYAVETAARAVHHGGDPAAALAKEAYERWNRRGLQGGYTDDITVVVKML